MATLQRHQTGQQPVLKPMPSGESTLDRARAYKSRNKRPCDFCRWKKAACHLESKPPCELCVRYNKECTFVESPAKRRRRTEQAPDSIHRQLDPAFTNQDMTTTNTPAGSIYSDKPTPVLEPGLDSIPWEMDIDTNYPATNPGLHVAVPLEYPFNLHPASLDEQFTFDAFDLNSASTSVSNPFDVPYGSLTHSIDLATNPPPPASPPPSLQPSFGADTIDPSLDSQIFSRAQIIGLSGQEDPYLLSKYRYDDTNHAMSTSSHIRKMQISQRGMNEGHPAYFTILHDPLASQALSKDHVETKNDLRRKLDKLVRPEVGKRLIVLFYEHVEPFFPILSDQDGEANIASVPEPCDFHPCVLATVYGHAIPFSTWDEKLPAEVCTLTLADTLFRLAWESCLSMLQVPNLALVQALLLLVQGGPGGKVVRDTPLKWAMMSTTTSMAQAIGLNQDCSKWPLSTGEIRTRKRLAWAVFVQDKWIALTSGYSSHIQKDNWDVAALTFHDFGNDVLPPSHFSYEHFVKLCELTMIVDDILRHMFSIKAAKRLQMNLEATLEIAKPLRIRLTEWYQSLPSGHLPQHTAFGDSLEQNDAERSKSSHQEFAGSSSLHLAYLTAKIELFRAMLRPNITDSNATAITALRIGALAVAKEMLEFLETLRPPMLITFWPSYARTNFAIASSFMLLLFVTSPTLPDANECLSLLSAWRRLLRFRSRNCDLLNLALLRLDDVFIANLDELIDLSPAALQAWTDGGAMHV